MRRANESAAAAVLCFTCFGQPDISFSPQHAPDYKLRVFEKPAVDLGGVSMGSSERRMIPQPSHKGHIDAPL